MALITYPRSMPSGLLTTGIEFMQEPMIEVTPLRSGRQISANLGPTLWRGKWTAENLQGEVLDEMRAWYDTVLSIGEFYAYDRSRPLPRAYPDGFGALMVGPTPFTGVCSLLDVEENNVQVTLTDLPVGYVLSVGDYLAFDYGTESRALHRLSAAAVADGGGDALVELRPHIRPGWESEDPYAMPEVTLVRASARMVIIPGTYSETIQGGAQLGSISFEAIQTL